MLTSSMSVATGFSIFTCLGVIHACSRAMKSNHSACKYAAPRTQLGLLNAGDKAEAEAMSSKAVALRLSCMDCQHDHAIGQS